MIFCLSVSAVLWQYIWGLKHCQWITCILFSRAVCWYMLGCCAQFMAAFETATSTGHIRESFGARDRCNCLGVTQQKQHFWPPTDHATCFHRFRVDFSRSQALSGAHLQQAGLCPRCLYPSWIFAQISISHRHCLSPIGCSLTSSGRSEHRWTLLLRPETQLRSDEKLEWLARALMDHMEKNTVCILR